MNVTNAPATGLIGLNRTNDNAAKAASDSFGSGKPEDVSQATGVENGPNVKDTTVDSTDPVQATKVVTETERTQSGIIDLHV